jgi:hypothetical protein
MKNYFCGLYVFWCTYSKVNSLVWGLFGCLNLLVFGPHWRGELYDACLRGQEHDAQDASL